MTKCKLSGALDYFLHGRGTNVLGAVLPDPGPALSLVPTRSNERVLTDENAKAERILANFYKTERARDEQCLKDIVDIVCASSMAGDKITEIQRRLEAHYERNE